MYIMDLLQKQHSVTSVPLLLLPADSARRKTESEAKQSRKEARSRGARAPRSRSRGRRSAHGELRATAEPASCKLMACVSRGSRCKQWRLLLANYLAVWAPCASS